MGDYYNNSGFYDEQRRDAYFNDRAEREADAARDREKAFDKLVAQDNADRAAANEELRRSMQGYGPRSAESSGGSRSYPSRSGRRRVENPPWLGIVLFLVIFAAEILGLHVTTVNGFGWNSGGGVIVLGLLAWLATFIILKIVLLFRFMTKQGRR